jgi:hypothetical protein
VYVHIGIAEGNLKLSKLYPQKQANMSATNSYNDNALQNSASDTTSSSTEQLITLAQAVEATMAANTTRTSDAVHANESSQPSASEAHSNTPPQAEPKQVGLPELPSTVMTESKLLDIVKSTLSTQDVTQTLIQLLQLYPELTWLTGEAHSTPEGISTQQTKSFSSQLYGKQHIGMYYNYCASPFHEIHFYSGSEFDRTIVGILCLFWVLNSQYESFTACQRGPDKLTQGSFSELKNYTEKILFSWEMIDLMVVYLVLNDMGMCHHNNYNISNVIMNRQN